jgi:hypothetical protein
VLYKNRLAKFSNTLRIEGVTLLTFFTPSLLTLIPFVRARKRVQTDLVSHRNTTPTVSKSDGRVRSWLSEAPSMVMWSRSLLERKHQPRDHHREKPRAQFRPDGLENKQIFRHTRWFHYCAEKMPVNKRTKRALESLTGQGVVGY